MKRIHIIGGKNSGKTTLIVDLVETLRRRELVVGTIKHTHHQHELDTPGKDSHRHRIAGASAVGILSPRLNAVFLEPIGQHDSTDEYDRIAPLFKDCDLVLVEGHSQSGGSRIEVWRAANERPPMALADPSILAVVTDDVLDISTPVLPRSDVERWADQVLSWASD